MVRRNINSSGTTIDCSNWKNNVINGLSDMVKTTKNSCLRPRDPIVDESKETDTVFKFVRDFQSF